MPKARKALGSRRAERSPQALLREFVKMGARYVSTGTDLSFLLGAATAKAKQVHEY